MRKSPIAIAALLLVLLGLVGGAPEARAEHKVLIAVVPAHWAAVINMAGHPFVKAFSPLPPHVSYSDYEPSPEDIRRALQADIIVVGDPDRVAAADDLIRAAQRAGKRYISVEEHPFRPSGVRDSISAALIMLENVKYEVVMVAGEKGIPEAEVRKFLIRYDTVMATLAVVAAYSAVGARGMKVALFSAGDSQYMWMLVDPVAIVVEESEAELRLGDLAKLKEAGVRCVVILDEEKVGERVFSELRNLGIKPIVGAPSLNYGRELIASCAEEPAPAPEVEAGVTTIAALGVYAAVAMLALLLLLAFLLLRRR